MKRFVDFIVFVSHRISKKNRCLFFAIILTSIISVVISTIMPLIQRQLIHDVGYGILNTHIWLLLILGFILILCSFYEAVVLNRLNINIQNSLHKELFAKVLRHDSKIKAQRGSGAFLSTMLGDSERIAGLINTNYFVMFLVFLQTLIIVIISTMWSHVFLLIVLPIYIVSITTIILSNHYSAKSLNSARDQVITINPILLEFIENRQSLLSFGNINSIENNLFQKFDARDKLFQNAFAASTIAKTALDAFKTIGLVVLFFMAVIEISYNRLDVATFIALLSYYAIVFAPINAVQSIVSGMTAFKMHHQRIADDLEQHVNKRLPYNLDLTINDCSFSYDKEKKQNLKSLSLRIDQRIGIVGISGVGKSTIIKMLQGDLLPNAGQCLFGDVPIHEISKAVLYSSVRIFGQENELYDEDLNFNITLGKTGLLEDEYDHHVLGIFNQLNTFSESSNLVKSEENLKLLKDIFLLTDKQIKDEKLILSLYDALCNSKKIYMHLSCLLTSREYYITEKYDLLIEELEIGHLMNRKLGQRGANVSGGEKNRICLARFILPQSSGFFVLDEPLVSVDANTEHKCRIVLKKYLSSHGIIISHKLNLIKDLADTIMVLDNGEVVANGQHDELMKENGLYSGLYTNLLK